MAVNAWSDVPAGMAAHHHCVVSVELSGDPRHWVDASETAPDLVAWQPQDVAAWVRDQLDKYRGEAHQEKDLPRIDEDLSSYDDGSDMWSRLVATLQQGRWWMHTYQLSVGRKLVLQVLSYADAGQPAGVRSRRYVVCNRHQRPDDKPYLGLTDEQESHFAHYR